MIMNSELRRQGSGALKGNWQNALLVALIASVPSLVSQVAGIMTHSTLIERIEHVAETMTAVQLADPSALINAVLYAVPKETTQLNILLLLISLLLSPVLNLGLNNHLLKLFRHEEGRVTDAFSRMRCFLKALLMEVWIYLKVILWTIPGIAAMTVFLVAIIKSGSGSMTLLTAGYYLSYLLMMVPAVMCYCRCSMAAYIMAEKPETGVFASVKQSKKMMKNHIGQYFAMMLTYLCFTLIISLACELLSSMFGFVVAQTASMMLQLVLTVYITAAYIAFYLHFSRLKEKEPVSIPPSDLDLD